APRQLLVDISELVQSDSKSKIHHAVRSVLQELLLRPPPRFRVEPVHATPNQGYRYARRFTLRFLNCPESALEDDPIEFRAGDLFLGLGLQPEVVLAQQAFYQHLRNYGVQVRFVVYDLPPITLPDAFPEEAAKQHQAWLKTVAETDGAICISRAGAEELTDWLKANGPARCRPFKIDWFPPGAEADGKAPSSDDMPRLTWRQSTQLLLEKILPLI
ncbi:MAG: glycosyl transferase family 1, partial [Pseudomonadota bacterium]